MKQIKISEQQRAALTAAGWRRNAYTGKSPTDTSAESWRHKTTGAAASIPVSGALAAVLEFVAILGIGAPPGYMMVPVEAGEPPQGACLGHTTNLDGPGLHSDAHAQPTSATHLTASHQTNVQGQAPHRPRLGDVSVCKSEDIPGSSAYLFRALQYTTWTGGIGSLRLSETYMRDLERILASHDDLLKACEAHETYLDHVLDCSVCMTGPIECQEAKHLWGVSDHLRKAAIAKAKGEPAPHHDGR